MRWQRKSISNKGFTLIELLVGLLITGILIATVTSVLLLSQKVYTRGGDISYKEGTVTNTETNLQNQLAVATGVSLESAPKTDDEESYSIGFNTDGDCLEYSTTTTVDGSGNKQYSKTVTAIPHLSEIEVEAMNNNITTLNYKLIPQDNTMSTLGGGTVMNNITATNKNQPTQATLVSGAKLKDSGDDLHYLVLTFKDINSGSVVPGKTINDMLKDKGINVGNWNKMIAYAKISVPYGYTFVPKGAVYSDSTGTYVTAKAQYISRSFAEGNPTAQAYYDSLGGTGNDYFFKISETTRCVTEADYATDPYFIDRGYIWKVDQYPKLGDLYLYKSESEAAYYFYIWENKGSSVYSIKDATKGQGWLKLVDAPKEFQ